MNDATQFFNTVAGGGYQIERSLRFNSADSAYLDRTPSVEGNRKTWTWAGWVKFSGTGGIQNIFSNMNAANNSGFYLFRVTTGDLEIREYGITGGLNLRTTAVLRDFAAWYHLVFAYDSTQATPASRARLYINGIQETAFQTSIYQDPNVDGAWNTTTLAAIGNQGAVNANYLNGYLADVHFIDGQALDPSSFGEFDTNGVWQPIVYAGSYGTNGFHLPFSDNSTAAALGTDTSGNGNTWTVNNISVAAGAGNDSLVDTPTNYGTDTGAGGEVRGNYATWNPLIPLTYTLANGNLDAGFASGTGNLITGTTGVATGKWYWEVTVNSGTLAMIGIADLGLDLNSQRFNGAGGLYYYQNTGGLYGGLGRTTIVSDLTYGATFTTGDIIGVALDMDSSPTTLTFYKNNVSQGVATNATMAGKLVAPAYTNGGGATNVSVNFGQRPFAYPAPSGFKALCTTNLPEPTIADGSTAMDVALYDGTANTGTVTVSGLAFSPDLVWVKNRVYSNRHGLIDTVRGANKTLASDLTFAEVTTQTDLLTSFTSDGFTVGGDAGQYGWNWPAANFVAWTWDAGSSTVTNNDGSITSQVRANPSAGFSVATLTTPSSGNFTVGHGLNIAPSFVICKARNQSFTWLVYHKSAGAGNYLILNTTAASAANSTVWQNTDPSSTLVYGNVSNWGTADYVMYSFAPVAGYSAFGSYTGNGSADGPFVYTGFRPRWILVKNATTGSVNYDWFIWDTARSSYNTVTATLFANLSDAEQPAWLAGIDVLSNGFKFRDASAAWNGNGQTLVYAAFAESPFQYSRAR